MNVSKLFKNGNEPENPFLASEFTENVRFFFGEILYDSDSEQLYTAIQSVHNLIAWVHCGNRFVVPSTSTTFYRTNAKASYRLLKLRQNSVMSHKIFWLAQVVLAQIHHVHHM